MLAALCVQLALGLVLSVVEPQTLARSGPPWNGLALDTRAGRIYLPGAGGVRVLDLAGRDLGRVAGLAQVEAVGLAPELGIGFAGNGRTNTVSIFNLATLEVEKRLRTTGDEPGAVLFEPASRRLFAFNRRGQNVTAFDAYGGGVAASIPLGGPPGPAVADGGGRVYASLGPEIVVVDGRRLEVVGRWPLPAAAVPVALALDPERQLLYLTTRDGQLWPLDVSTGALRPSLATGAPAAGLVCDPGTHEIFVASDQGSLWRSLGDRVRLPAGARGLVLDTRSHRLYIPYVERPGSDINTHSGPLVVPIRIIGDDEAPGSHGKGSFLAR